MASNYTPNFGLSQWSADDAVLRADFNEDNRKIDAALCGIPKIAAGTYTGTGGSGSSSPNYLTFDFEPQLVIISQNSATTERAGVLFLRGQTGCGGFGLQENNLNLTLSWEGPTVVWYTNTGGSPASLQMNSSGSTYHYFALGW